MNRAAKENGRAGAGADPESIDPVFRAIASRPRRDILRLLVEGTDASSCCGVHDACSCDFAEKLGLSPATVSHHMKVLIESGVVSSVKRGLWVYYRIVPEAFDPVTSEILSWSTGAPSE